MNTTSSFLTRESTNTCLVNLEDLKADNLEDLNKVQQSEKVIIYLLEQANANDADHTRSSKQIVDAYIKLREDNPDIVSLNTGSLATNASLLSKESSSIVSCTGRRSGYFLNLSNVNNTDTDSGDTVENDCPVCAADDKIKEQQMYAYLVNWLIAKGLFCVKNVANSRKMGQWGNPDVLGVNLVNFFGNSQVELTTIEAKITAKNWRKDIFEAVAHTVFADYVYFAFLKKQSEKIDQAMIRFAQKFNIGILAIEIPDENWGKRFDESEAEVWEVVPAPCANPVQSQRVAYLKRMGITDTAALIEFKQQEGM